MLTVYSGAKICSRNYSTTLVPLPIHVGYADVQLFIMQKKKQKRKKEKRLSIHSKYCNKLTNPRYVLGFREGPVVVTNEVR